MIVTRTGIAAAVRILCVRVHSQQRVRNLRNFAPLQKRILAIDHPLVTVNVLRVAGRH
jgi:hypothetical protein